MLFEIYVIPTALKSWVRPLWRCVLCYVCLGCGHAVGFLVGRSPTWYARVKQYEYVLGGVSVNRPSGKGQRLKIWEDIVWRNMMKVVTISFLIHIYVFAILWHIIYFVRGHASIRLNQSATQKCQEISQLML